MDKETSTFACSHAKTGQLFLDMKHPPLRGRKLDYKSYETAQLCALGLSSQLPRFAKYHYRG